MKKIIFILSFAFVVSPVIAQTLNVDSLIRVAQVNTSHIRPASNNRDSLFRLLTLSKSLAQQISLTYTIIGNGDDVGVNNMQYHYKIIKWATQNHNDIINSITSAELGFDVSRNGDEGRGLKICIDALKQAEKTGNNTAIGVACDNLGVLYSNNNNLKLAKQYYQQGLQAATAAHDYLYTCFQLENFGFMCVAERKLDSAEFYFKKSFQIAVTNDVRSMVTDGLTNLAILQKDEHVKLKYLQAAGGLARLYQNRGSLMFTAEGLADYFLKHHETDSALHYSRIAYNAASATSVYQKKYPDSLLMTLFRKVNADSALKYTDIYYAVKDSINNTQKIQQANRLMLSEQQHQEEEQLQKVGYQNRLKLYLLAVIIGFLLLIAFVFWKSNFKSKKANTVLRSQKEQIQTTLQELKSTQTQLIQSEKMASLGELTAGVAHEIQNPLNFVNNFSEVSMELVDEMELELREGDKEEAISIAADIKQNLEKIIHHGKRADGIVKGMLQHSRSSSNAKEPTDINKLADEYLRLAYHGLRAKDKSFNAELITTFAPSLPQINVVPQDIGRVLLNLFTNAFYSVHQKQKTAQTGYAPTVELSTGVAGNTVTIKVKDNGLGIPDNIKNKIMQPFFTTKPTGEGTGLGLSLSYDIVVKGHGGKIDIDSKEGEYTEFIITIPI
jgi:two-component system NtrC family sensor kinase